MKKIISLALAVIAIITLSSSSARIQKDGTYKGVKLYGKVKVVTSFPTFKVKVVSSFEDLDVQVVSSFPDKVGKWQFVDSFEDFSIQYVDSFEDFSIKFVDSFPGVK